MPSHKNNDVNNDKGLKYFCTTLKVNICYTILMDVMFNFLSLLQYVNQSIKKLLFVFGID